jgi:hypothetical protein
MGYFIKIYDGEIVSEDSDLADVAKVHGCPIMSGDCGRHLPLFFSEVVGQNGSNSDNVLR